MTAALFRRAVAVPLLLAVASHLNAGDWPAFRGPHGDGHADGAAPTKWSASENVAWKTPLPRPANGSPIVSRGSVFVTCPEDGEGKLRSLYCFDARSGKLRWVKTVDFGKQTVTHDTNPYCGTTPVSNGKQVVVWHGSAGLFCYDLDGSELWSRNLGEFEHMWGYGTSPILHDGRVILHTGPSHERIFTLALRLETGETVWQTDEPQDGDGDHRKDGKYHGSWSTPIVAKVGGETQLIVSLPSRVNGYDPRTGKLLWWCDGLRHDGGDLSYSSPIACGDLCFITGGFNGPAMAFRLGGRGNLTDSGRLWRREREPQSIGTGVFVDGFVYRPNAGPGTVECVEPSRGDVQWTQRASANSWSSIVAAGGLLYSIDQNGTTVVFKPNPEKFEEVATNSLGEATNATPAVADGRIYIRTAGHLWCME